MQAPINYNQIIGYTHTVTLKYKDQEVQPVDRCPLRVGVAGWGTSYTASFMYKARPCGMLVTAGTLCSLPLYTRRGHRDSPQSGVDSSGTPEGSILDTRRRHHAPLSSLIRWSMFTQPLHCHTLTHSVPALGRVLYALKLSPDRKVHRYIAHHRSHNRHTWHVRTLVPSFPSLNAIVFAASRILSSSWSHLDSQPISTGDVTSAESSPAPARGVTGVYWWRDSRRVRRAGVSLRAYTQSVGELLPASACEEQADGRPRGGDGSGEN